MKSVLISIKPQFCGWIMHGLKTIEVRKTIPRKIKPPFKCYVYCTKIGHIMEQSDNNPACYKNRIDKYGGKVIGEFICTKIDKMVHSGTSRKDVVLQLVNDTLDYSLLTEEYLKKCFLNEYELEDYSNGGDLYGWHISDLVIYDEPKELDDFHYPPEKYCEKELCGGCPYDEIPNEYGECEYDCEWKRPIARPPQSWCYVEV